MAIVSDIKDFWIKPRDVFRKKLAEGPREDRSLILLMTACFLLFVGRWPSLARQAHLQRSAAEAAGLPLEEIPSLQALLGINFFVMLFAVPLLFYALAAISTVILRLFRRKVQPFASRLALIWALLAVAPLALLHGLLSGFLGSIAPLKILGVLIALAFLWLWSTLLSEAAKQAKP